MASVPWTDEENDLIVADYFTMLADDIVGKPVNKAASYRQLAGRIARTKKAVEYKHQNISAVLMALGQTWMPGLAPAFNFQDSLVDAVVRWLNSHPDWMSRILGSRPIPDLRKPSRIRIEPPPPLSNWPSPQNPDRMLRIARKFDVAGRDAHNRTLCRAGEKRVLEHEQALLRSAGRDDLARKVRWVSQEDGDGAGYDIASFAPDGLHRLIKVKTTNGWKRTAFHITYNELDVTKKHRSEWHLFRLWDFARAPKAFELRPPLDAHVSLIVTTFEAGFH